MGDFSEYHNRLAELAQEEARKLGNNQAALAERLGYTSQTISNWVNAPKKLDGALSPGGIAALAKYLNRSPAALTHYLETGEWIADEVTLADRVEALEKLVRKLSGGMSVKESAAYYVVPEKTAETPALLEMTPLGKALQSAFIELKQDWREPAAIAAAWGVYRRSKEQGGLGYSTDPKLLSLSKFQQIIWGLQLPTEKEAPDLALIVETYTGDPVWSHEYVLTLAAQHRPQTMNGNTNGMSSRVSA